MLAIYRWTVLVFLAAGVVQIFLAGLGAFKLLHRPVTRRLTRTGRLVNAMAGVAIITLILTVARPGTRAIVGAALLVLMTVVLQSL
jgi:hypothetical protein